MHRFLLTVVLFCLIPTGHLWAQYTALTAGESVARDLGAGGNHGYTMDLSADQFVSGVVDQHTVDVVVNVYGPGDEALGTFDSPARGPEPFHFTTENAGTYRIEVSPFQ